MSAFLYILRCADGSYYVGTTRDTLERRVEQHQAGTFDGYTALRRPVTLVFQQYFDNIGEAIAAERQVKGRRREKKEALIRGVYGNLPLFASRSIAARSARTTAHPSRRAPARRSSGCGFWIMASSNDPHPEEAAKRPSRRMCPPSNR